MSDTTRILPMATIRKPTPDELAKLRELYPQGMPRIDYREMTVVAKRVKRDPDDPDADDESQGGGGNGEVEGPEGTGADALIAIAISSETPVLRYDWWSSADDPRYWEVLDHSPKSVMLDYARDGLPFIASHRSYDADQQHGLVENVRVEQKVLRGDVKMSKAQRSQEIAQDMRDGIRKKVSVGYIVGDQYDQTTKGTDGIPIRRYTAWMPLEVSTVPVPADYAVGVGRAQTADGQAAIMRFLDLVTKPTASITEISERQAAALTESIRDAAASPAVPAVPAVPSTPEAPKAEERTMPPETGTAPGGATNTSAAATSDADVEAQVTRVVNLAREQEAQRAKDIVQIAGMHGLADRAAEWLAQGKTVGEVLADVNKVLAERIKQGPQHVSGIDLPEKDRKRYLFSRALIAGSDDLARMGPSVDVGLEREVLQEARRQTPQANRNAGFVMPYSLSGDFQGRAGVDSATTSTGGIFKFTQPGEFIPILRNKMSVTRAGAIFLPGLTGPVTFPKQLTAATANWVGENPGSDNTPSNLTNTSASLAFKTLQASTSVSRQALFSAASGNYALDQIIMNDLALVIAIAIDLAGLNGLGSSNQPLGILQDTNVGTATALGAQGGTISWGNVVDLETAIGNANADMLGALTYITNPNQRARMRKAAVLGNTAVGVPIWQSVPGEQDGVVNGYRAIASNQVPANLTKGTTTGCSAMVFGAFEQLIIGQFGAGFETLVDPYSKKNQNMIEVTSWNFIDVCDKYPVAFATLKDLL